MGEFSLKGEENLDCSFCCYFQGLIEGIADLSEERRQLSLMGTRAPDHQPSEEGEPRFVLVEQYTTVHEERTLARL